VSGADPAVQGADPTLQGADAADVEDGDPRSFEELVAALEALTTRMAAGDIGIEEAASLYEQAQALHDRAAARLARVQQRIERLQGGDRV
jgi:exodeoxyribonuclease VII small subunit